MEAEGTGTTSRIAVLFARLKTHQKFWQRAAIATLVIVLAVQASRLVGKARGDFNLHWELGRRLVAGEFIYHDSEAGQRLRAAGETDVDRPLDHPYPPFWALAHAPLTIVSMNVAQLALYPLIAVSLFVLLWTLHRLCKGDLPLKGDPVFWISAFAILMASRFVVRDAPECGVNLALVAMSWLAVYLWTRKREVLGGTILGCAVALKCTPALFLPYFMLKRQWKMAAATTIAAGCFTLSPILVMGPARYGEAISFWVNHTLQGIGNPNPSIGVLGDEQLQNVSLRPALSRFLMHLPEGHKSRFDHPLSFDFFNFSPVAAGIAVKMVLLALVGGIAWMFRARVVRREDLRILWECSTVSVLILLLSPITWGQHCVGVIPMFYLFARSYACKLSHARWTYWMIGGFALFTLILNRSIIGKDLTWLLDSYRLPTWCLLALVAVAVGCHLRHVQFQPDLALGFLPIEELPAETKEPDHVHQTV